MPRPALRQAPPFQHKPLDLSGLCVRLLEVLPRDGRRKIRCKIRHVHLLGRTIDPKYIALSYLWGNTSGHRRIIHLDNRDFAIQESVYQFLDSYGKNGIPNLWVDSICIDQCNTEERNHQVQLMQEIYSRAAKVVIWLGPSNLQIEKRFDMLNDFHILESTSISAMPTELVQETELDTLRLALIDSSIQATIRDLCHQRYWTRAWIVQEILLAHDIELVCGAKRLPWNSWIYLLRETVVQPSQSEQSSRPVQTGVRDESLGALTLYHEWVDRRRGKASQSLWSLVRKFAGQDCLHLSDKVYAFLGLAADAHHLQVDYNMSLESLFLALLAMAPTSVALSEIREVFETVRPSPANVVLAMDLALTQGLLSVSSQRLRKMQEELLNGTKPYPFPQSQQSLRNLPRNIAAFVEPKYPLTPREGQGMNAWYRSCQCHRCLHSESSREQIPMTYLHGADKRPNLSLQHASIEKMQLQYQCFTLQGLETEIDFVTLNDEYIATATSCSASGVTCCYYESLNFSDFASLQKTAFNLSVLQVFNLLAHQTLTSFEGSEANSTSRKARFYRLPAVETSSSGYHISGYEPIMNYLHNTGIFQINAIHESERTALWTEVGRRSRNHQALSFWLSRTDIKAEQVDIIQRSALMHAVHNKDQEALQLLASRPDILVDRVDVDGVSAFIYAVKTGNQEAMQLLASRPDVMVDRVDIHGNSAFMYAVKNENRETIHFLAARTDVNVDRVDRAGQSAFFYAVSNGDRNTIALLSSKKDLNFNRFDNGGKNPLIYAILNEDRETVEFLSSATDANINSVDSEGKSALIHAILNDEVKTLRYLLSREDVDINLVDQTGRGALSYAAKHSSLYLVGLLAPRVRDICQTDMNGDTVLHHLVSRRLEFWRSQVEEDVQYCILALITQQGALLTTRNLQHQTPYDVLSSQLRILGPPIWGNMTSLDFDYRFWPGAEQALEGLLRLIDPAPPSAYSESFLTTLSRMRLQTSLQNRSLFP